MVLKCECGNPAQVIGFNEQMCLECKEVCVCENCPLDVCEHCFKSIKEV